jgi:hypothetical protein
MRKFLLFTAFFTSATMVKSQWSLTGNSSTNPSTNFIGTTDGQPLAFRTSSVERLRITLTGRLLTTIPNNNLFIGQNTGNETTSGSGNNVGLGSGTLIANSTGYNNIGIGGQSLSVNTTGRDNAAIGYQSLVSNTSGIRNVALGSVSLNANSIGNDNVGIGTLTMLNSTTGSGNTAIGYFSMQTNTTGTNNTVIGNAADVSANNLTNATAIGFNARVSASNSLVLGGTGTNQVNVGIGVTNPSSRLEINSGTTGSSGLKFTQLSSSSATASANGKSLSLDAAGNIILVPAVASDGSGTKVTGGSNINVVGLGTTASPYVVSSNFPWTS